MAPTTFKVILNPIEYLKLQKIHLKNFDRVLKRRKALEDLINHPLIIETTDGAIYGGGLDGYESGTIWLFSCQQPADDKSGWVEQTDILTEFEGKPLIDRMPAFALSDIRNIYTPKNRELSLDDALSLWLDPLYRPAETIECGWNREEKTPHSKDCDAELHESLTDLFTAAMNSGSAAQKAGSIRLERALKTIHRFITENGGRIP